METSAGRQAPASPANPGLLLEHQELIGMGGAECDSPSSLSPSRSCPLVLQRYTTASDASPERWHPQRYITEGSPSQPASSSLSSKSPSFMRLQAGLKRLRSLGTDPTDTDCGEEPPDMRRPQSAGPALNLGTPPRWKKSVGRQGGVVTPSHPSASRLRESRTSDGYPLATSFQLGSDTLASGSYTSRQGISQPSAPPSDISATTTAEGHTERVDSAGLSDRRCYYLEGLSSQLGASDSFPEASGIASHQLSLPSSIHTGSGRPKYRLSPYKMGRILTRSARAAAEHARNFLMGRNSPTDDECTARERRRAELRRLSALTLEEKIESWQNSSQQAMDTDPAASSLFVHSDRDEHVAQLQESNEVLSQTVLAFQHRIMQLEDQVRQLGSEPLRAPLVEIDSPMDMCIWSDEPQEYTEDDDHPQALSSHAEAGPVFA